MSDIDGKWRQAIERALASGDQLLAIRHYRQATGVGLAEAKSAIEAMASGHRLPGWQQDAGSAGESGGAREVRDLSPQGRAQVVAALQQGRKIDAIKHYRDDTGAGLEDAKNAVEALARRQVPASAPEPTVRPQSSSGWTRWWLVLVGLALLAYLWARGG
jgi:ribosomal protein L7/L12